MMSDRFEHEILVEEPGHVADKRSSGIGGVIFGVLLAGVVLLALFIGGRVAADWLSTLGGFGDQRAENATVVPGRLVIVDVPSGASAREISGLLVQTGVIESSGDFERAVADRDAASLLKAGGYELVSGTALDSLIDILIEGPNLTTFRVTIVEGRRINEVMDDLVRQSEFSRSEFVTALVDGEVQSIFLPVDVQDLQAWEGLLFPDTYEFFVDATPPEILQRLANEMERRVSQLDWTSMRDRGYSLYEGLVMASMVESEAAVDQDRPVIASVLYNRLDQSMMLQIDATVLYAMGERRTGLTLDDLEFDSPYNTYLIPALPPTPIGAPGFASLSAVASPADTEFVFYVLSAPDGSHTFTVTYEEFLVAKEQARQDGILP